MNHKTKTTEFSAHFSISRMGRYLNNQLSEQEVKAVELHLTHCERCSEGILEYIQTETPHEQKMHLKRLKGILKSKPGKEKRKLSTTQIKSLRAVAALVLLFVFSFFAVKTVMKKNAGSENLAKTEIKQEKNIEQKRPVITPQAESNADENDLAASKDISSEPVLAMQKPVISRSSALQRKNTEMPKATQENPAKTTHKKVTTSEAPSQITSENKQQEAAQITEDIEVKNKPANAVSEEDKKDQMQEGSDNANNEKSVASQTLPMIEKLDIQKTEDKAESKPDQPSLPAVNMIQRK